MDKIVNAVKSLKAIVEKSSALDTMPQVNDDSVRIKHFLIKSLNGEFSVVDTRKKIKFKTYTKAGAIALAKKMLSENEFEVKEIIRLDQAIEKHQQDCVFYDHCIEHTTNELKKSIMKTRLDLSCQEIDTAKARLNNFIFDSI